MYIKIFGSKKPGHYQNTESSVNSVNYTAHDYNAFLNEELEIPQGTELTDWSFKDMDGKSFSPEAISIILDQNVKNSHLSQKQGKFYCIVISPSEEELSVMGDTLKEKLNNGQIFIQNVMDEYAKNFNKSLNDRHELLAFSIAHYTSKNFSKKRLHWHVMVSRVTKKFDILHEICFDTSAGKTARSN